MTSPIILTETEIAAVSGGVLEQSISLSTIQTSSSAIGETANVTSSATTTTTATGTLSPAITAGPGAGIVTAQLQANLALTPNNFIIVAI